MFHSEPEFFARDAEDILLREYQLESIEALRANFRAGIRSQVLASMVGSGKTVMGAFLLRECWRKERRGMFVVDRINLLDQTSAVFDRYGIPHGVIQSGHPRYKPGELIQVASIQTLARRSWPQADLIIGDEVHTVFKCFTDKIAKEDARIIGLTATPFTRGMAKHYKAIVNVTTGNKLTADGFLVPFKVWAAKEPDMTGAKVVAGEWTDAEASKRSMPIVGDVVAEYQRHGDGRKFIGFGVDVAHCEEMQRQFLHAGIKVELYTYRTDDIQREYMLREFRKPDSEIRGLISVAALSRGFDVPDVGCIIMCRPLKSSFSEFVQVLGRGLRPFPAKENCIVLDLAGNFLRHYPRLVEFMEEGVNELDDGKPKPKQEATPAEKKPRKCPRCGFLPISDHCPSCGFIPPPRASVEHAQGSLEGFTGEKTLKLDRAAKIVLLGELKYYARMHRYAEGWVAHRYKAMTGVWPRGIDGPPIPTSDATLERLREEQRAYAARRKGESWRHKRQTDLFA